MSEWLVVIEFVVIVALGAVAWWFKVGKNTEEAKKELAKIIGDIIASVIAMAQSQMASVTDEMLTTEAGFWYDKLTDLLSPNIHDIIVKLYDKQAFAGLVIKAWRNLQVRSDIVG